MKKYIFFQLISFFFMFNHSVAQIAGNWKAIGPILFPTDVSGQINGIGRVSQIKFHSADSSKMYAASASGGLWISNNGAESWQRTGTDNLPRVSCASVCIDYTNDQVIYLGTGDANYYGGGYGVWKSTDAGQTWNFSNSGMGNRLVIEILMHTSNHNELIAATDNGIYKSYDAGATWIAKKNGGAFTDMIFKPSPFPSTIYAATFDQFFRSTDMGETWSSVSLPGSGITGGGRLAVSKANPEIVYVTFVGDFKASASAPVLRSTNSGQSFSIMKPAGLPNLNGYRTNEVGQGNYNYSMTADPYDANIVYITGHVVWKSVNGGVNWTQLTDWWAKVHTDMHDVKISPYNSSKLFNVNDGGVWLSTDGGNNWTPKSNGLEATECYHAGQSRLRKDMAYIGTQDNGELYFSNNAWVTNRGGDLGSKIVLSYQDEAMAYYLDDGTRRRLNNFANRWAEPDFGNKETEGVHMELEFTPLQKNVAFFSKKEVWRTDNLSSTSPGWKQLTNIKTPVKALAVSPVSANTLYVVTDNGEILRSDNALSVSPSFVTLSAPAATNVNASITGIKTNQNVVYITCGSRVYRSADKGVSWTNISDGLPNVNIIKIHHDIYSQDESVYVGMATGVYYKNNSMSKWQNYSKGLPTIASINEFMIFIDSTTNSVLRVAFWGRGVWETPLSSNPTVLREPENPADAISGVDYSYYKGSSNDSWNSVPDFNTLTAVETGTAQNFDLSPHLGENIFALRFSGFIDVPADGQYTFYTTSDDGSRLYIGDQLVVDNDGLHGSAERSGTIGLKAGKHAITVTYFENQGDESLEVSYAGPAISRQPIPDAALFRHSPVFCAGTGTITREQWDNIGGESVSAIPVATPPSSTMVLTKFEAAPNTGDNYGSRIRGYICPPYTGNYTFWIASDDESELWLSTNADPANKIKLAYVMSYVAPRDWEAQLTQRSAPVYLLAGQTYYIEALQKEGGGSDHLAVGWQLPTGGMERPMPGNRLLPMQPPALCAGTGTILREQWDNIGGNAVSAIPVTTPPSATGLLTQFEATPNTGDGYGSRVRGYICAPVTGNYTFWIASDDESELWLSTNENPANKVKIAFVSSAVDPRNWEAQATQRSAPVYLLAGQKYYIEALQKEGGGSDHLAVGWQLPTGDMERPIPGNRLLPIPPLVPCTNNGIILREQWDNIGGNSVSAIPVATRPSSTMYLEQFEATPNTGDNYGSRIRGHICPPYTGDYTFWIASDDASELWLSTNENPVTKVKIAFITSSVGPRNWEAQATQRSAPVYLVAGQKYYIEALQKEGVGDDHLAVGWQLPTGELQRPIPGNRLAPIQGANVCPGNGSIFREQWDNIGGNDVAAIPVTSAPSSTGLLTQFEATPNTGDNYGSRTRGYICTPYTGNYTFWIASDDASELWLSTNENPANKVKIAFISSYVDPRNWEAFATQRSAPVFLVAGRTYYIEALQKEGGGSDHLAVGWQLPTGDMERPIPGNRLLPVATGTRAITTTADQDTTAADNGGVFKNYPNPFARTTTIEFSLTQKENVSLVVYDMQGNKVSDLYNGNLGAGTHTIPFNAERLASGYYICRLLTKERSATIKMIKVSRPAKK